MNDHGTGKGFVDYTDQFFSGKQRGVKSVFGTVPVPRRIKKNKYGGGNVSCRYFCYYAGKRSIRRYLSICFTAPFHHIPADYCIYSGDCGAGSICRNVS